MSKNTFAKIGDRIKESPFVVPIYWMIIVGFLMSLVILANDFYTGYAGVLKAPKPILKNEFEEWLYFARMIVLAGLPQVVGVIGVYISMALNPENQQEERILKIATAVTAIAVTVDLLTGLMYYFPLDITFQNIANNPWEMIWSIIMSGMIDTIGSELMFIVCFGLAVQLRSHAQASWNKLALPSITAGQRKSRPRQQNRNKQRQQPDSLSNSTHPSHQQPRKNKHRKQQQPSRPIPREQWPDVQDNAPDTIMSRSRHK